MSTSQSRWMTLTKPSVAYIPLSQRLTRNDMRLGSTSLVQCDDIDNYGRLMINSNSALGSRESPYAKQPSKH